MNRRLPGWLSTALILIATFGILWILKMANPVRPVDAADDTLAQKNIAVPDLSGTTLDGKPFRLSEQKGKIVLVNFWATWCGPCRMEIPDLIALQKKYADKGFTVVGIAEDEPAKTKAFVEQIGINYPVMIEPDGAGRAFGVTALPSSVLVNRDGKVIYAMRGIDTSQSIEAIWSSQIDKAL